MVCLNGKHGHFVTPAGTVAVKNWTLQFGNQWANSYNPVFSRAMEPWNPSFIRNLQKETSTDCSQTPGWSKPNKPQQPSPLAAPSRPVCLSPASQWQSCLAGNRMDSTGAAHAGKETQPSFRRTNHENKFSWCSIPKTKNKKRANFTKMAEQRAFLSNLHAINFRSQNLTFPGRFSDVHPCPSHLPSIDRTTSLTNWIE